MQFFEYLLEAYTEYKVDKSLFINPLLDVDSDDHKSSNHHDLVNELSLPSPSNLEKLKDIQNYTEDSGRINSHLWDSYLSGKDHFTIGDKTFSEYDSSNHSLYHFLKDHPTPTEDIHVFTGLKTSRGITDALFQPKKTGESDYMLTNIPSYTSTSLNPTKAKSFATSRRILRIKIKKGQQVGGYIQPHSTIKSEEEFTLLPNHILKINKEGTNVISDDKEYTIHDAEILHHSDPQVPEELRNKHLQFQDRLTKFYAQPSLADKIETFKNTTDYHDIDKYIKDPSIASDRKLSSILVKHESVTEKHLLTNLDTNNDIIFANKHAYGPRVTDKVLEHGSSSNISRLCRNPALSGEDINKIYSSHPNEYEGLLSVHDNTPSNVADHILNNGNYTTPMLINKASPDTLHNVALAKSSNKYELENILRYGKNLKDETIHHIASQLINNNEVSRLLLAGNHTDDKTVYNKVVHHVLDNEHLLHSGMAHRLVDYGYLEHKNDESIKQKLRNSRFDEFRNLGNK